MHRQAEDGEGEAAAGVPASEVQARLARLQEALPPLGADGVLLFQNVDLYYFTGTMQRSALFVPAAGAPLLMVVKSWSRAREESPLERIRPIRGLGAVWEVLEREGHGRPGAVGLELDVLPAGRFLWCQEHWPETRWLDVSQTIRRVRMVKSEYEVAQFRKGTAILDRGFAALRGFVTEGMTELEVDGHLALVARREGHMGVMRMRAFNQEMTYAHVLSGESGARVSFCDLPHSGNGSTPAMPQGAGFRRIGRNEPIGVDYGVAVNGYVTDQFRTVVLGRLDRDLARAHDCAVEILQTLERAARPGTLPGDLYHLAVDIAAQSGLTDHFMGHGEGRVRFVGHGLGLEIDEYPILTPGFTAPLEEGMVLALEPKFVFPGRGVVGIEDDYVVRPGGLERLTLTEQAVLEIPEAHRSRGPA